MTSSPCSGARRARRGGTAAEAGEYIVENIAEAAEAGKSAEAARSAAETAHVRVVEFVVVLGSLLGVGKDFVRLVDLLELRRRVCVAGVKVGVVLFDEFAIRRFDVGVPSPCGLRPIFRNNFCLP